MPSCTDACTNCTDTCTDTCTDCSDTGTNSRLHSQDLRYLRESGQITTPLFSLLCSSELACSCRAVSCGARAAAGPPAAAMAPAEVAATGSFAAVTPTNAMSMTKVPESGTGAVAAGPAGVTPEAGAVEAAAPG